MINISPYQGNTDIKTNSNEDLYLQLLLKLI